ncbi:MAG TPA: hypothetical protein PKO28_04105 [Bacilli bacterium]|mgnify:CR=1 FL=1|nr:hypothetical protein [Bacilli bacterium]
MAKNKWKKLIEGLGYSFKKEIFKIAFINLVTIASLLLLNIFVKEIVLLVLSILSTLLINYLLFSFYNGKKEQMEKMHGEELIALLSYLRTFIDNHNNIYQSFQKLVDFASPWMKEKIGEFLLDVDSDKSVKPFIDFAANFSSSISKNLMLSIYQMIDQGENSSQLSQFTFLFQNISNNYNSELRSKKQKSLGQMAVYPLVGAGAIVLVLSFSIISVVGDMVNVL